MKRLPVCVALIASILPLCAQDLKELVPATDQSASAALIPNSISDGAQSLPEPVTSSDEGDRTSLGKRTFIPQSLEVKPFIPPPPPVVKRLPAVRVEAATSQSSKNAHSLTLQRGVASSEPDLPPPPPAPPYVEPRDPTPEEKAQRLWQQRHILNLGATVYDHKISVVNWTDLESLTRHEAVCGFDVGLLAGIGDFVHSGESYSIFLTHSDFDTTWERRLTKQWQPEVPEVSPGEILITQGDEKDSTAADSMAVIREIIAAETPRLIAYQAERRVYFAASAAWHAAHPPVQRDETFLLRPHRGSHYTADTKSIKPVRP